MLWYKKKSSCSICICMLYKLVHDNLGCFEPFLGSWPTTDLVRLRIYKLLWGYYIRLSIKGENQRFLKHPLYNNWNMPVQWKKFQYCRELIHSNLNDIGWLLTAGTWEHLGQKLTGETSLRLDYCMSDYSHHHTNR